MKFNLSMLDTIYMYALWAAHEAAKEAPFFRPYWKECLFLGVFLAHREYLDI